MTERTRERPSNHFDLPTPGSRVMVLASAEDELACHLVLPDASEATLCQAPVPANAQLSTAITGKLCPACKATADSIGTGCTSCGMPLLAEFDTGLCFACTCRTRGY